MIRAVGRERIAVWLLAVLLIATSLGVVYVGTPYTATPAEIRAVEDDPGVAVSALDGGYVLEPTEASAVEDASMGLVFYPGARVDPSAYLETLAPVVDRTGATVYIPRPALNLAVFDARIADPIIDANPKTTSWYVGGHSLGGAMACRFADRNADRLDGLVLFGSYCDRDLAGSGLRVLSVQGSADTVIDRETAEANREFLPNRAVEITIDGMNHTQFGSYRGQPGDSPATISYEQAHEELGDVLVAFLRGENASAAVSDS